jgi:hypothetical protein
MIVNEFITPIKKALSQMESIPILSRWSPSAARQPDKECLDGYKKSQALAFKCAAEVAKLIQPGWTEHDAAKMMEIWLRDHGVKYFFHKPFVWWGDRTRFNGVRTYRDYQPTSRRLLAEEVFILDVAPIVDGYISDIGYSGIIGDGKAFIAGQGFLTELRREIPKLVTHLGNGGAVWRAIDAKIKAAGYENIHATYPFGVLGHRVHQARNRFEWSMLHFGWQSYWEFTSRGLFGQLLDSHHSGRMEGLWAIEPHIGGIDFGMKFEEILVVENGEARWLESDTSWSVIKPHQKFSHGTVP